MSKVTINTELDRYKIEQLLSGPDVVEMAERKAYKAYKAYLEAVEKAREARADLSKVEDSWQTIQDEIDAAIEAVMKKHNGDIVKSNLVDAQDHYARRVEQAKDKWLEAWQLIDAPKTAPDGVVTVTESDTFELGPTEAVLRWCRKNFPAALETTYKKVPLIAFFKSKVKQEGTADSIPSNVVIWQRVFGARFSEKKLTGGE